MCCAIAGGWNISRVTVEKMCIHQNSRGPDSNGIKEMDKVIFGHSRLAIVDKSEAGNQPMIGRNVWSSMEPTLTETMITYNGEIYGDLKTSTDSQDLLNSVKQNIDLSAFLNSTNGMFAFAFYNDYTNVITLVKDRFGIKPLYFYRDKDFFAFASTPAAVSLTKNNWSRSEKGLHEYLSLGATILHSMFDGIEAVPPGHYVTFNCRTQELKVKRWYYPKFIENAYEKIEELVSNSIERVKLTCDEPQIILLSGGVDSSLVASRYKGRSAIHLASPEQEYAQKVADKFQIKLNNVHPSDSNAEECLTDYITKSGDPTMAGLIPYITCKEIKKLGFRVAITANGADELFFGYDRMKDGNQVDSIMRPQFLSNGRSELDKIGHESPQIFEIDTYLTYDLNKTLDFASMCHSVEVRVPYLDHELVEAALSIPQSQHISKYGNKTILKKMLLDLGFDFDFIHRPKIGFSLHHEPADLQSLKNMSMAWYNSQDLPKLGSDATPRQHSYHEMTVVGLYLFNKIYSI